MGNFRTAQNTFLGGILGESALGRTDTEVYKGGATVLDNCIPSMSGSLKRLPHNMLTYPKALLEDATYTGKFSVFGMFQGYYLVTSPRVSPDPVTGATNGIFLIDTSGNHYTVVPLYPTAPALGRMANHFMIGTAPNLAKVMQLTMGDVAFFFGETFPPHVLVRAASGVHYIAPWDAIAGTGGLAELTGLLGVTQTWAMYPYQPNSTDGSNLKLLSSKTILEGKTRSGGALFTGSADTYLGRYVKVNNGANTSVFFVTEKISNTQLKVVHQLGTMVDNNISDDYAFSYYGPKVFPTTACFFQGRLVYSGATSTPQVFFSRSGNFFTFMQDRLLQSIDRASDKTNGNVFLFGGRGDDWPVALGIATNDYASTRFVQSGNKGVFVGTSGGLYIAGGNNGAPISPTSFTLNKISEVACNTAYPAFIDGSLFFAGTDGEILYTRYSDEGGGDSVAYATALYRPFRNVTAMCYDEDVDALFVTGTQNSSDRAEIGVMSFSKINNSLTWSLYRSELSVNDSDVDVFDLFRRVTSIPRNGRKFFGSVRGNGSGGDVGLFRMFGSLYTNVNADFMQFVSAEAGGKLSVPFYNNRLVNVYTSLSSGIGTDTIRYTLVYSGTVSGNQLLEPTIFEDGFGYYVALPSEQIFESVPIVEGGDKGSADMARKRIDRVFLRVRNATPDVMIGTTEGGMAPLFGNEKTSPYTGIVEVSLLAGQGDDAKVRIVNRGPYSFELLSMVTRGVTFD